MIEKVKDIYNKFTTRERILFYSAIGVILFVMTDFMVLRPIFSHIRLLDAEIKAKSQAIQRDLRILSFKDGIYHEYKKYENYLDTGARTQEEIISTLLRKLETVAGMNSVTIVNVSPGEIEDKPIYKIYKTTLEFEGELQNVFTFMTTLEESDNLFQITRYVLGPKSRTSTIMKCNMDITRILMTAEDMQAFAPDNFPEPQASNEPQPSMDQEMTEPALEPEMPGRPAAEPI